MKSFRFKNVLMCSALLCVIINAGCSKVEELPAEAEELVPAGSLSANDDDPYDDSRYIYSQLSDKEKEYYGIIRDAAFNFEEKAVFPETLDPNTLRKLYVSVYYQEEELFWLSSMFYRPAAPADTLMLSYRFTADEADQMKTEIAARTDEIFGGFDSFAVAGQLHSHSESLMKIPPIMKS